jgi:hypothetical protein
MSHEQVTNEAMELIGQYAEILGPNRKTEAQLCAVQDLDNRIKEVMRMEDTGQLVLRFTRMKSFILNLG